MHWNKYLRFFFLLCFCLKKKGSVWVFLWFQGQLVNLSVLAFSTSANNQLFVSSKCRKRLIHLFPGPWSWLAPDKLEGLWNKRKCRAQENREKVVVGEAQEVASPWIIKMYWCYIHFCSCCVDMNLNLDFLVWGVVFLVIVAQNSAHSIKSTSTSVNTVLAH